MRALSRENSMSMTVNDFDIHAGDVGECELGTWKNDHDWERGVTGGEEFWYSRSGRERVRQELRALNERMLRGVGRLEAREGR
jgi:hypothetical protein